MASSEVSICNIALAALGSDPIHSLEENNKRSRLCKVFYPEVRDLLLSRHDWAFARKYVQLQEIADYADDNALEEGYYAFALPSDCLRAIDLDPIGLKDRWELRGSAVITVLDEEVYLKYTRQVTDVGLFSSEFKNILAFEMALHLAMPLTMDKKTVEMMRQAASMAFMEGTALNANIGSEHRNPALDPVFDTFVNPPE